MNDTHPSTAADSAELVRQRDSLAAALQRLLDAPTLGSNEGMRRAREVAELALSEAGCLLVEQYKRSTEAHKWGYAQLQAEMLALGREGWARDYDSEIQGRIGMAYLHPERSEAYAYEAGYRYLKSRFTDLGLHDLVDRIDADVEHRNADPVIQRITNRTIKP